MLNFGSGAHYGFDSGYDSAQCYGFGLDPGYSFGYKYRRGYGYGLGNYFGLYGGYVFYPDYSYGDVCARLGYVYTYGCDDRGSGIGDGRGRNGFRRGLYERRPDDVWRKL